MRWIRSPGEAEVLGHSVVRHHHRGRAGGGAGAGGEKEMSAVFSVGLLPPPHQTQAPAPPGELPALPHHGPEEAAGLLHGQEGGQVQVGQEERDHRRGEGGEQGAPPPLAITGAHHHHPRPVRARMSVSSRPTIQRHCVVSSVHSSPTQCFLFT